MELILSEFNEFLKRKSLETDELIFRGYTSHLGILEETITDRLLLDISYEFRNNIFTHKFSRKYEGTKSGADWLWCIGEPGNWLSLNIQAKIINPKTGNCRYLNYSDGHQRKLMRDYARKNKLLPLYCIYNSSSLINEDSKQLISNWGSFHSSLWGCVFMFPSSVRKLVNQKLRDQGNILKHSFPWHLPFEIGENLFSDGLGIELANSFKLISQNISTEEGLGAFLDWRIKKTKLSNKKRIDWGNPDPLTLVSRDLPKVVENFIKGRISELPFSQVMITTNQDIFNILSQAENKRIDHDYQARLLDESLLNSILYNFKEKIKKNTV